MALTQKTGYSILLVSALMSLLQAIYNIAGQTALLFGNIALVCFGLGALIIISKALCDKFLLFSCLAAVLTAVLLFAPYGVRFAIAFACLAPYAYDKNNVPRILSVLILAFGFLGIAAIAFSLFSPLANAVIYACAAASQAAFAWLNIKYEDGMVN